MHNMTIQDDATTYVRVSKATARKVWERGEGVYIIAHKMRPGYPFSMGMIIAPRDRENNFDKWVNNFTFYNCSYETGYYPAFYLTAERSRKEVK